MARHRCDAQTAQKVSSASSTARSSSRRKALGHDFWRNWETAADQGGRYRIGIGAEDLALVVRPFHRRKPAFDARHQGAGLGLPFAKTIVELHGGKFAISSIQGAGTTVTIELPLATDEALNDAA